MKKSIRKPHRIRHKKSIFKKPIFWWVVLFLLLIAGGVYFFVFFEKFQISKITVLGNGKVQTAAIERLISAGIEQRLWLVSSKSIFLANPGKINKVILGQYPVIDSVGVKKHYPDSITVIIKEREPFVILCEKTEDCFFLDENGVAFEQTVVTTGEFPIVFTHRSLEDEGGRQTADDGAVILGKEVVKKELMEKIVRIKKDFEEKLNLQVKEINIPDSIRLDTTTNEGWQVYFGLDSDINLQITKLNYLLEKELPKESRVGLQYIDLRFKDRVYYK